MPRGGDPERAGGDAAVRCKCGHDQYDHQRPLSDPGRCETFADGLDDPFIPMAQWTRCACEAFDDSALPEPGERLVFGVHYQPTRAAESAEAWPSLPSWSARVRARTTRALRGLR